MKLVIPGVNPKYNLLVIIAVVVILIFVFFPNIMRSIIGGTIKGIGGGIQDGLNSILQTPVDPSTKDAMTWLDNWGRQHSDGWFLSSALYDANPADASIDANTAKNLLANVKATDGWFSDDMSSLEGQFRTVVGNQTDISRVATLFYQEKNASMSDWMFTKFYSRQPVILMNFIKWGMSLPTN